LSEPEPVLDAIEEAARRLVSPIDLLDFTERIVAQRASGLDLEEARTEAIATVLARRLDVDKADGKATSQVLQAIGAAVQTWPLSREMHAALLSSGLAEPNPDVRPPVLDWVARPAVLERVEQWLFRFAEHLEGARTGSLEGAALQQRAVLYRTAGKLAEVADPAFAVDALVRAADWYRRAHCLAEALEAAQMARTLAGGLEDPRRHAGALRASGDVALRMADFSAAKDAYEAVLPIFRAIGDRPAEANVLMAMGDLAMRKDKLPAAKEAYEAALLIFRATGDRRAEAGALLAIGRWALRLDRSSDAKEAYEAALLIYQEIGDRLGEAKVLHAKGNLALRTADLSAANRAYEAALSIFRAIGTRIGEANVLRAMGDLAMRLHDPRLFRVGGPRLGSSAREGARAPRAGRRRRRRRRASFGPLGRAHRRVPRRDLGARCGGSAPQLPPDSMTSRLSRLR
jgi:tetratricopeptide (TPR) repeat protein